MSRPTEMKAMLQGVADAMETEIERYSQRQGFTGSFDHAGAAWLHDHFPAWKLREWDRALREADRTRRDG